MVVVLIFSGQREDTIYCMWDSIGVVGKSFFIFFQTALS